MLATSLAALALTLLAAGDAELPVELPLEESSVASRHYVIERIELEGLKRTRLSEAKHHLGIAEGELLDDKAVVLARLRLLQLGWFSKVETRVERGNERGWVVLVFDVEERNTLVVSDLVMGSTGPQAIYGGFGLSEGNFLGLGLGLSGAFVYGGTSADDPLAPARFALRAALFDPELTVGGVALVGGVSALFLRGEEFACSDPNCNAFGSSYGRAPRLRYQRAGGEATFGFKPGSFERLMAGFRLERISATLPDTSVTGAGTIPTVQPGRSLITALTATYDRDTRSDLFFPTSGTHLSLNVVLGTEALGGDYEYSRYLLQVESDHALPSGHALRLLGAAGAVQGEAPFFERFYPADFAYFSIGPALGRALELNFSTDSRYDAYLAMLGTEYAIPLWSSDRFFHRGYLAVGARWLYTAASAHANRTAASETPFSADLALRLDTPVGSFNLSLGYALDNFL